MERTGIVNQKQEEVFGLQMSKKEIKKLGCELGQILSRDVLHLIETDEFQREYQAWKVANRISNINDAIEWKIRGGRIIKTTSSSNSDKVLSKAMIQTKTQSAKSENTYAIDRYSKLETAVLALMAVTRNNLANQEI